jgi:hypothetical protein
MINQVSCHKAGEHSHIAHQIVGCSLVGARQESELLRVLMHTLSLPIYCIDSAYKKLTAGGGALHDLSLLEEGEGGIQLNTMSSAPPAWVADVQAVEDVLVGIQRDMTELQAMHASRLGSVFGKDLENMEGRIEKMTRDMTDQFRYAERLLQKVGMATRRDEKNITLGANIQRR